MPRRTISGLDNNGNPILNATHQPVCKPTPADAFGKAFNPNGWA